MTKRKVIEDSDDDDNAETTPPRRPKVGLSEADAPTVLDIENSLKGDYLDQLADPSTGSTGWYSDLASALYSLTIRRSTQSRDTRSTYKPHQSYS